MSFTPQIIHVLAAVEKIIRMFDILTGPEVTPRR
jgi:hypothetical protein